MLRLKCKISSINIREKRNRGPLPPPFFAPQPSPDFFTYFDLSERERERERVRSKKKPCSNSNNYTGSFEREGSGLVHWAFFSPLFSFDVASIRLTNIFSSRPVKQQPFPPSPPHIHKIMYVYIPYVHNIYYSSPQLIRSPEGSSIKGFFGPNKIKKMRMPTIGNKKSRKVINVNQG